jgi:hypothetical protein
MTFMIKGIVSTVLLLFSAVAAFSQSVRDQATELLLRAEKVSLQFPTDGSSPYHERVKFTLSGFPPGDIQGQIIKDYLSSEQWRQRDELGTTSGSQCAAVGKLANFGALHSNPCG